MTLNGEKRDPASQLNLSQICNNQADISRHLNKFYEVVFKRNQENK